MMTGKELVAKIREENQPLFEASKMNIRHWFNDPARTKEEYLLHFQGRLANEYMNMIVIGMLITGRIARSSLCCIICLLGFCYGCS